MAVDVSRIPNNNKFDPVREAILQLQTEIEDTGAAIGNGTLTINTSGALTGSGTFTANQAGASTITIGLDDSSYLTEPLNWAEGFAFLQLHQESDRIIHWWHHYRLFSYHPH